MVPQRELSVRVPVPRALRRPALALVLVAAAAPGAAAQQEGTPGAAPEAVVPDSLPRPTPPAAAEGTPDAVPGAAASTLPFRTGQWAAQFTLDQGMAGVGALWFRSATRAWLVDARFGGWYGHDDAIAGPGGAPEVRRSSGTLALRLGPRFYRALASDVAGFAGAGLRGATTWHWRDEPRLLTRQWAVGPYAEVGASYLVTRRLSLGAFAEVEAAYRTYRSEFPDPVDGAVRVDRGWEAVLNFVPVRVVGTLYF